MNTVLRFRNELGSERDLCNRGLSIKKRVSRKTECIAIKKVQNIVDKYPRINYTVHIFCSANEALTYDSVLVITESFNALLTDKPKLFRSNFRRGQMYNNGTKGIDCMKENPIVPWEHGSIIVRYFKKTITRGLTGNLMFSGTGFRRNFSVDISQMTINSQMSKVRLIKALYVFSTLADNVFHFHQK
ncbi:glutamate receptor 1-like protein [Leptotrombidium deliense]|uniref:Glutamate receptor 1-like protein n=1 Tax=Leptotrombidium deliense TaxID=299467 RepID=A0A443S3Q5_9ACAR|nr:glutamate receptor 1-like protein [Leptotrombidium deliense]